MNRNARFFNSLSPLAHKLEELRDNTPPPLSKAKDYHECMAKKQAKLARRAARAGHKVPQL